MKNCIVNRFTKSYRLSGDTMEINSGLPANQLNILPYLNLKNESNYILDLYIEKPITTEQYPFMIIEPFESVSFMLPEGVTTEGVYVECRLIGAEPIKLNMLTMIYSDVNLMWCEKKDFIKRYSFFSFTQNGMLSVGNNIINIKADTNFAIENFNNFIVTPIGDSSATIINIQTQDINITDFITSTKILKIIANIKNNYIKPTYLKIVIENFGNLANVFVDIIVTKEVAI